jgi:hypothetical protein
MTFAASLSGLAFALAAAALGLGLLLARRYRDLHAAYQRLLRDRTGHGPAEADGPSIGTPLPEFAGVDVDGRRVEVSGSGDADLVVAFLSAGCEPCVDELPAVQRLFAAGRGGQAVAVVRGDGEGRTAFVDALRPVARVVVEDDANRGLAATFGVTAFPSVVAYRWGVVRQVTHRVADLDAEVA